jgi:hypothetical protein
MAVVLLQDGVAHTLSPLVGEKAKSTAWPQAKRWILQERGSRYVPGISPSLGISST